LIIENFFIYLWADSNLFIFHNKGRLIYIEEGRDQAPGTSSNRSKRKTRCYYLAHKGDL